MIQDPTPLVDTLQRYSAKGRISFHTPGHKGEAELLAPLTALSYDLTELPETGSLYDGGDAIEAAEREAARTFGAGLTLFSGGGCTLCIQTMLGLGVGAGGCVAMARNAHRSALHAAALLDLSITWLTDLSPSAVEAALKENRRLRAVYITSPDYYGRLADVAALSAVCRRYDAALLVDNAHGTHLGAFGLHPLALGADMTADSAHKTLPVLTGGAYLHIAANGRFRGVSAAQAKQMMALFGSTSPPFQTLASLDAAQAWWRTEGRAAFRTLQDRLQPVRAAVRAAGLEAAFARGDPVRVTLDAHGGDGEALAARLRENGCEPEYADARYVVLLPSPFHTDAQLQALAAAITAAVRGPLPAMRETPFSAGMPQTLPRTAMTPRQALLAAHEEIDTARAAGRIAAQTVCPCPPGVAAVASGEEISQEMAAALAAAGIKRLTVVGNKEEQK